MICLIIENYNYAIKYREAIKLHYRRMEMFIKCKGKSNTGYKTAVQFDSILVKFYILVKFTYL